MILKKLNIKWMVLLFWGLILFNACTTPQHSSKKESSTITKPRSSSGGMNSDLGDEVTEEAFAEEEKAEEDISDIQMNEFDLSLEELSPRLKDQKAPEEQKTDPQPTMDEVVTKKEANKSEAPPAQVFRVRFKIKNNNPKAVWYVMPYHGEISLSENGRFEAEPIGNKQPLAAVKYKGVKALTELIELRFTGKEGQHFRAFYVPANSSFTLANYVIDCWQETDKIELWAVKEMYVNNQRFLQDCLPFSALSSPDVVVRCSSDAGCPWEDLDLDNALQNATNELDIVFIQAQNVKKYKVQLSK
jgi:hypothetical protein